MATSKTTSKTAAALPANRRTQVVGQVVSNKMQQTISVLVYRQVRHKRYGKYIRKSSVFKAHDQNSVAKVGDTVEICESRPISKTKRWTLVKILNAARGEST